MFVSKSVSARIASRSDGGTSANASLRGKDCERTFAIQRVDEAGSLNGRRQRRQIGIVGRRGGNRVIGHAHERAFTFGRN
jgi:hypothetical protein